MADLIALVLGVALAAWLEWYSGWASQIWPRGGSAPRWYVGFYYVTEALRKGLIALIPVVICRRVRYGGAIRPAEFLALSIGVPRLLLSLERLPVLGLVTRRPGSGVSYEVNVEGYGLWMRIELAVSLLAVAGAVQFRRRLAPWVTCALLTGAWIASAPVEGFVHQGRDAILELVQWPFWGVKLLNDLLELPFLVFFITPMVLAVNAALRNDRPRWTWVERVCLGVAWTWFCGIRIKYYINMYEPFPGSRWALMIAIDLFELVIAAILCFVTVRRYGLRLGRWFGLGETLGQEVPPVRDIGCRNRISGTW